jgi:hypothetical protein
MSLPEELRKIEEGFSDHESPSIKIKIQLMESQSPKYRAKSDSEEAASDVLAGAGFVVVKTPVLSMGT